MRTQIYTAERQHAEQIEITTKWTGWNPTCLTHREKVDDDDDDDDGKGEFLCA